MKKFITLSFTFISIIILAQGQPVITQSNTGMVAGESFKYANDTSQVAYFPGPAGANQVWNLTSTIKDTGRIITISMPGPADSGYANYPSANLVIDKAFYSLDSGKLEYYGSYSSINNYLIYTGPEEQMHYPLTFNDTFSDTTVLVYGTSSQGGNYPWQGNAGVTADGYGTVITPAGTYTNALRVHLSEYYHLNSGADINYRSDKYFWFVPGIHYYVADVSISQTDIADTSSPYTYCFGYLVNGATATKSINNFINSVNLYPNPTGSNATLNIFESESRQINVTIINSLGQVIKTAESFELEQGDNELTISTTGLDGGIYFLVMRNSEGMLLSARPLIVKK